MAGIVTDIALHHAWGSRWWRAAPVD